MRVKADKQAIRRVGRPRKAARSEGAPSSRELILAAAAEVYAEQGFDAASLSMIGQRAGYSMGAIYHHYAGKPELLLDVVRNVLASHDIPRGTAEEPVDVRRWAEFTRAYLEPQNRQLRRLAAEIFAAASRHADVLALLVGLSEEVTREVVRSIELGKRRGQIGAEVDPDYTARLFMVSCAGLAHIETFYPSLIGNPSWRDFVVASLMASLGLKGQARAD
jgi:AcrR family transcriptional regulator